MAGMRLTTPLLATAICWMACQCACTARTSFSHERFSSADEGWTSDRRSLYAKLGNPDSLETGPKPRPIDEGEGTSFPFEIWHYHHLVGVGENVDLEFVDTCLCGNYKLSPAETAMLTPIIPDKN
jgi:hypothetical protein